ncbi:MAG: zinc-ribbon and DUF3426 domain-containing protein [Spongiibacteraceae bacterium]
MNQDIECPACNTLFRVSDEQRQQANGLLRCGICMHIFNSLAETAPLDSEPVQADSAAVDEYHPCIEDSLLPETRELLHTLTTLDHDFEHHQPPKRGINRRWATASALLVLVLLGQIVASQQQQILASRYGNAIRNACATLQINCEKPQPERRRQDITTTKLLVRKHPSTENALRIDAILLNRSLQGEKFPNLTLSFSDLKGNIVAQRQFTPTEYLAGELNQLSQFPSQQPVHIALDIVDPGNGFVSYSLALAANY